MALECLAILGHQNEPLYLCSPLAQSANDTQENDNEHSAFGFAKPDSKQHSGVSIRQEFMMHAALDRLEEILGSPKMSNLAKKQRGTKWMGSLLPMEDCEIYGYVTPSNTKILALIKRDSIIPLMKRKEMGIKMLFAHVHDCYVRYTMNPFTTIRGKIEAPCASFERGVNDAIRNYQRSLVEEASAPKS